MPIELTCPCGRRLRVADEHAGEQGRCPACGGLLQIPERDAPLPKSAATADGGPAGPFVPALVESVSTPPVASPEGEKDAKLTAAGCVVALLSTAVIFGVAIPIVRWRDPATGEPLPRTVAIFSPLLIGAAVNGIGVLLLKLIGVRVWVKKEE